MSEMIDRQSMLPNMNDLKPCPFCGTEAELKTVSLYRKIKGRGQTYRAVVGCRRGCTAQISQAAYDPDTAERYATDMWNRRTVSAEVVRHARWKHRNNSKTCGRIGDFEEWLVCSACDMEVECEYPNCPYCTARMDAKEDAE